MFGKRVIRYGLFKFLEGTNVLKSPELTEKQKVHYPVMYREVLKTVQSEAQKKIQINLLDCTIGTGAHAQILQSAIDNLKIHGIDMDPRMVEKAKARLGVQVDCMNFADVKQFDYDVVFADLGYNMDQILEPCYGLSYRDLQANLDMRYQQQGETASQLINRLSQQELTEFLQIYGGIRYHAKNLAAQIIENRPIQTIGQLVDICKSIKMASQIPQVFQTFRIVVNKEILSLQALLKNLLKTERTTKVLIITFHSLETDMIENFLKLNKSKVKLRGKQKPSLEEIQENPRSRSAKLINLEFQL